jgi:cyclopropane fatty-acyl-phospholipid synthase-like methyltransferase
MSLYNEYYKTENLFGKPYKELINFFEKLSPKNKLLDLGCGQGRNAIPLARMGYEITGIDNSNVGIQKMREYAQKEKCELEAIVADIYQTGNLTDYDIILLDSMFHFSKKDLEKERTFLKRVLVEMRTKALICICIQNTGKKVLVLKEIIKETPVSFKDCKEINLKYVFEDKETKHKSESKYLMLVLEKIK